MEKDFYTVKEVAEMYGLRDATIRMCIMRGQIKATKFANVNMITAEALAEWEATRVEKPWKRADYKKEACRL